MKQLLTPLFAFTLLLVATNVFGQCTPNPAFSNAPYGIYPYGPILMDCSGENATVTIVGLSDTTLDAIPGTPVTLILDAMRVDTVLGLPAGLSIETDVMASASADAPYGEWIFTGTSPNFDPAVGCMKITGSPSNWAAASTGGPNNDGVFPLAILINQRLAFSNPDISFIIPNGTWFSESSVAELDTVYMSLNVNGSACGASLFVTPQVTANTDTTQGCDGSVSTAVYGGQPPFSYSYSTSQSTQTVYGLCPGTYTVDVTDANGTTGTAEFAVGVASNVYSNVNPSTLPFPPDSLFGTSQNCDLDYSLPLDSFMITEALVLGTDTLVAEWVVYQLGEPYTIQSFYPNQGSNQTILSLVIYCENGRSQVGVFQLFEYVDFDATTGIEEQPNVLNFSVMPNPTSGILMLSVLDQTSQAQVEVFDPTGKQVLSQNLSATGPKTLDLQHLPDGMYIVRLANETSFGLKRIIKIGELLTN